MWDMNRIIQKIFAQTRNKRTTCAFLYVIIVILILLAPSLYMYYPSAFVPLNFEAYLLFRRIKTMCSSLDAPFNILKLSIAYICFHLIKLYHLLQYYQLRICETNEINGKQIVVIQIALESYYGRKSINRSTNQERISSSRFFIFKYECHSLLFFFLRPLFSVSQSITLIQSSPKCFAQEYNSPKHKVKSVLKFGLILQITKNDKAKQVIFVLISSFDC